jgi:hypothetical protein
MFSKPLLLCALLCALLLQPLIVSAAYCNGKPKPGAFTNDFPIVDAGLGAPVATVPNGAVCFIVLVVSGGTLELAVVALARLHEICMLFFLFILHLGPYPSSFRSATFLNVTVSSDLLFSRFFSRSQATHLE